MPQKILLTGASGEIGYEVLRELIQNKPNCRVRVLSLDRKYERKLFRDLDGKVDIVWGDIRDSGDVQAAVDGVDVIIHTAAVIPPLADEKPDLAWEVNVTGTHQLLEAACGQPEPPRFLYTSSIAVYGDRIKNPDIQVGDSLAPSQDDIYAQSKIECERMIRESGLIWSIFRLTAILTSQLQIKPIMFHMPLDTSLEWCHKSDVGYALAKAADSQHVWGKIFNLGGGEQCRMVARDFVERMMDLFGLPEGVLPEYAFALENFHCGNLMDGDILQELLGFQRYSLDDYFQEMGKKVSPLKRFFLKRVPPAMIRWYFLRISEPYQAIRANNLTLIKRFYGSRKRFSQILKGTRQAVSPAS